LLPEVQRRSKPERKLALGSTGLPHFRDALLVSGGVQPPHLRLEVEPQLPGLYVR
jgi:hypothetical protein